MKREEFFDLLVETIQTEDEVNESTQLESIEEWDSLATVATLGLFHKKFGFRPETNKIQACQTIGDLLDLADGKYE